MQEHCDLMKALEAGNVEWAGRVLLDHVRKTGLVVRQVLAQTYD